MSEQQPHSPGRRRPGVSDILGLVCGLIVLIGGFTPGVDAQTLEPEDPVYLPLISSPPPDTRFDYAMGGLLDCCAGQLEALALQGIGLHQHQLKPENGAQTFQVNEWYDWYHANRDGSQAMPVSPCVWSSTTRSLPTPDACTAWIQANPGRVWIIGNEPNLGLASNGGALTPIQYAEMYYQSSALIRAADPTARIAVADVGGGSYTGTCQILPEDPYLWLERAIRFHKDLYGVMNVDFWTLHLYTKYTPDISTEKNKVRCFREHMLRLRRGGFWDGNFEVWITEFGWHGGDQGNATPSNVSTFMTDLTEWLRTQPDVTRWFWWPWFPNLNLLEEGSPTPLGLQYSNLARIY